MMDKRLFLLSFMGIFASKLLILGGNWQDAVFFGITAIFVLLYNRFDTQEELAKLSNKIKELEKNNEEQNKRISEIINHVGSLKLSQNIRVTK